MMKSLIAVCAVAGMLGLSACSGWGRGETVGTVGTSGITTGNSSFIGIEAENTGRGDDP